MPTLNERITALKKEAARKQRYLEKLSKTLKNTQTNIKKVNEDIAEIEDKIGGFEARLLTDALRKKGIKVADIAAAVEAGIFDDPPAPEKPPDVPADMHGMQENTQKAELNAGTTYSTENAPAENSGDSTEKEDTDDIGDS